MLIPLSKGTGFRVPVTRHGTANVLQLIDGGCAWEAAVRPLEWPAVEAAWAAAAAAARLRHGRDGRFLARLVSDLADAHLVHLEPAVNGHGVRLWPITAAQAAAVSPSTMAEQPPSRAAAAMQQLAGLLQGLALKVAERAVGL